MTLVIVTCARCGRTRDKSVACRSSQTYLARRPVPFDALSRRNVVWLLTLALAVIGSQLAHELAYRLVTPDGARRAHELAQTGHAYLVYAPAALAVCSVLVLIALGGELRHLLRRGTASPTVRYDVRGAGAGDLRLAGAFRAAAPRRCVSLGCMSAADIRRGSAAAGAGRARRVPPCPAAPGRRRARSDACSSDRCARRVLRWRARSAHDPLHVPRVPVLALGYGSRGPPGLLR